MVWVIVALAVVVAIALGVAAWVSSGPRFQSPSRGHRPTYDSRIEKDAVTTPRGFGQFFGASRGPK